MAILEFWTWNIHDFDKLSFHALWVVDGGFQYDSSVQSDGTILDHNGLALLCRIAQLSDRIPVSLDTFLTSKSHAAYSCAILSGRDALLDF